MPNILDVKLGTVLYDEDAPPEKRERMEKKARDTTSGEVGIRLTGRYCRFLVINHDNPSSFRRIMGNPFVLQNFLQVSHGFSPFMIRRWREGESYLCLMSSTDATVIPVGCQDWTSDSLIRCSCQF